MGFQEIMALRKEGRHQEALALARSEYAAGARDVWTLRAYGWCLYDAVKAIGAVLESETGQLGASLERLTRILREFAAMAEPLRRDKAFSNVLRLTIKVARMWPSFLGFAKWAGIDSFETADTQPTTAADGKRIDSVRTRFIRAICRETSVAIAKPDAKPEWIAWGEGILEKALETDPRDPWLPFYRCKVHEARGEREQAIARMVRVVRKQSRAAWSWAYLGQLLEGDRPGDALVCVGHATQVAREEQELAKVRLTLARLLAGAGRHAEAAEQVRRALRYREDAGIRRLPPDLEAMKSADWYTQAEARQTFQPLPDQEAAARALLASLERSALVFMPGVVDHLNMQKALTFVATGPDGGVPLHHDRFPEAARLEPGTVIDLGCLERGEAAVEWRPSDATTVPGLLETFRGTLEKEHDREFAFIRTGKADIYVPKHLAGAFAPEERHEVICTALRSKKRDGKVGWRATRVDPVKLDS